MQGVFTLLFAASDNSAPHIGHGQDQVDKLFHCLELLFESKQSSLHALSSHVELRLHVWARELIQLSSR
jgi:hypothetical protein